ncbi:MAG TPA: alpha-amylase family glycosyl hydrolase [Acidobacteriota bacterium]|nr:alpha-amylase family glycosyl hydrolase [Acidobacteriota bacterium]
MNDLLAAVRVSRAVVLALCLGLGATVAMAQPAVEKVEPPNWWPGHSINPVRLLIRGEGFAGAQVSSRGQDVSIGLTRVNAAGTYLFADLHIDPQAQPGTRTLQIESPQGSAQAEFEILQPLSRQGRFQGIDGDDVIYLLMPDRFANGDPSNDNPAESPGLLDRSKARYYHGGDLQGVIDRLPYLKDLGVTAIWMNPWYDNVNHLNQRETYDNQAITDYHGYGAVDFYAVEEHFGDLALLRKLVDEAHRLDIKIIQDQVANHSGPYHPWVTDSPTPTWYNGTQDDHLPNEWQTWTLADPHASEAVQKPTLDGWFIDILPDMNQGDAETARYIIQNTLWWIGISGLDAIRQDTLPYVPRWFWRDWMTAIKREYPRINVVGEFFEGNPSLVAFFQGGQSRYDGVDTRLDTLFDFPLYYGVQKAFTKRESMRSIARIFAHDHLYTDPDVLVTFIDLHDTARFISEPGADLEGLKLAYSLIFAARGIPLIYYGTEIAMEGGGDPDNRRDFPGGWPSDQRDAFTQAGRTQREQDVFAHVRRLTHLRRSTHALRHGEMIHLHVGDELYAFARVSGQGIAVAVFNNADQDKTVTFKVHSTGLPDGLTLADELQSAPQATTRDSKMTVTIPARAAALYFDRR